MPYIGLIAPTPIESVELRREIKPHPSAEPNTIYEGELGGQPVIFTHCGVGKVNASHSATLMLENYAVEFLVLFGIGGAYIPLNTGDIAVAENENYAEEGILTGEGWNPMEFMGLPLLQNEKDYYNTFPMDADLIRLAFSASKKCGFNVVKGNFVTVSMCSGTRMMGEILKERFNGICENMEGAAVAHICALYGVPAVEIRGISNIIEERKEWNIEKAASNCGRAVIELVKGAK